MSILNINSATQKVLGNAAMSIDGDTVYLQSTDKAWNLALAGGSLDLPDQILDLLEEFPRVDWKILNARTIDVEVGKFAPERGRAFLPIEIPNTWSYVGTRTAAEYLEKRLGCLTEDGININARIRNADLRVYYGVDPDHAARRENHHAIPRGQQKSYAFYVGERVLSIDANLANTFIELGMDLNAPFEGANDAPPYVGVLGDSGSATVYGILTPTKRSGIVKDAYHRKIFGDAAEVSWVSEQTAWRQLKDAHLYAPPINLESIETFLDALQAHRIQFAIGALRWGGIEDEEILRVMRDAAEKALVDTHQGLLEEIKTLHNLTRRPLEWEVKRLCEKMESLQDALGNELDLGLLPKLVQKAGRPICAS